MAFLSFKEFAGSVIGAGVGFAVGGPPGALRGAVVGYSIGSSFERDKADLGGLEVLPVLEQPQQPSIYGKTMPKGYGTVKVTGNVIWMSGVRTEESEDPEFPVAYKVDLAVSLCEGLVDEVSRIWANGELIYDEAGTNNLTFTFYPGNEQQTANQVIADAEEAGDLTKTPAFRGQCYVVFEDFDVTKTRGAIPDFAFEVVTGGDSIFEVLSRFDGPRDQETNIRIKTTAVYEKTDVGVLSGVVTGVDPATHRIDLYVTSDVDYARGQTSIDGSGFWEFKAQATGGNNIQSYHVNDRPNAQAFFANRGQYAAFGKIQPVGTTTVQRLAQRFTASETVLIDRFTLHKLPDQNSFAGTITFRIHDDQGQVGYPLPEGSAITSGTLLAGVGYVVTDVGSGADFSNLLPAGKVWALGLHFDSTATAEPNNWGSAEVKQASASLIKDVNGDYVYKTLTFAEWDALTDNEDFDVVFPALFEIRRMNAPTSGLHFLEIYTSTQDAANYAKLGADGTSTEVLLKTFNGTVWSGWNDSLYFRFMHKLENGVVYRIANYTSGDDFSNAGGPDADTAGPGLTFTADKATIPAVFGADTMLVSGNDLYEWYEAPGLLRSYEVPTDDALVGYLRDRCFTYDQSVAIIAAVNQENQVLAERWVTALIDTQEPIGSTLTSGNLSIGKRYEVLDAGTGADFANVLPSGAVWATGLKFVAQDTTPTSWGSGGPPPTDPAQVADITYKGAFYFSVNAKSGEPPDPYVRCGQLAWNLESLAYFAKHYPTSSIIGNVNTAIDDCADYLLSFQVPNASAGSEEHTGDAAADNDGEVNATGSWANSGTSTFQSQGSTVTVGSFALEVRSNADKGRMYLDLGNGGMGLEYGLWYKLEFWARHVGAGTNDGDWRILLDSQNDGEGVDSTLSLDFDDPNLPAASPQNLISLEKTDTTWQKVSFIFCMSTNTEYLVAREINADNDGGIYFDAMTLNTVESGIQEDTVRGGRGQYALPSYAFFDAEYHVFWSSVEHNLDSYFALKLAGDVRSNAIYTGAAANIGTALSDNFWWAANNRFYQGTKGPLTADLDQADALDLHSWGSIFLRAIDDDTRADLALHNGGEGGDGVDAFKVDDPVLTKGVEGYTPYIASRGYPQATGALWGEGTLGVALAYLADGDSAKAQDIYEELLKLEGPFGLPYTTVDVLAYELQDWPSVASNGWVPLVTRTKTADSFWEVNSATLLKLGAGVGRIIANICDRCGFQPHELDTDLVRDNVNGYLLTQRAASRNLLQAPLIAGFVDVRESDGKISFVSRAEASVQATWEDADVGAYEYGSNPEELLTVQRTQEIDAPDEVTVQYFSRESDFLPMTQTAQRAQRANSNLLTVNVPMVLSDDRARSLAEGLLMMPWLEQNVFELVAPFENIGLDPGDLVTLSLTGRAGDVRLITAESGRPGLMAVRAVPHNAAIYQRSITGGLGYGRQNLRTTSHTTLIVMPDIPLITDADIAESVARYYIAAYRTTPAEKWSGSRVYKAIFSGGIVDPLQQTGNIISREAAVGNVAAALPDGTVDVFDETNSIVVNLDYGTLTGATEGQILTGGNLARLGNELLSFKTVAPVGANYCLTGLLRGRRGTEHETDGHGSNEQFVLLTAPDGARLGGQLFNEDPDNIGKVRYFKGLTTGLDFDDDIASAAEVSSTMTLTSMRPYSPILTAYRDGNDCVQAVWTRRDRAGHQWPDGSAPTFSEGGTYPDFVLLFYLTGGALDTTVTLTSEVPGNDPKYLSADAPDLVVGEMYEIRSIGSGADFSNVGADVWANNARFTATGTKPTNWGSGVDLRLHERYGYIWTGGLGSGSQKYDIEVIQVSDDYGRGQPSAKVVNI